MAKENNFYEEPQPCIIDTSDEGIHLGFCANGRNVSDFLLTPSDIDFLMEEFCDYKRKHPNLFPVKC